MDIVLQKVEKNDNEKFKKFFFFNFSLKLKILNIG